MPSVTIFGSSRCQENSDEYKTAFRFGKALSELGFDIVTGAYSGIMEAALKGTMKSGVERIGISTEYYKDKTINQYVDKEIKCHTYMDRLNKLIEEGNHYLVLPGGTGTLLELSTIWALKSREDLAGRKIECFGDQWSKAIQTLAFYSHDIQINLDHVKLTNDFEEAVKYLSE